jgi:hypothetical protein
MKTRITFSFLCLFGISGFGQITTSKIPHDFNKTDLQELKLNGKVKSIRETSYLAITKEGTVQKGKIKREEPYWSRDFYIVLNADGNKTERTEFNSNGSFYFKMGYEYIDTNVIKEYTYKSKDSITNSRNVFYKHDGHGNVIEESWNKADGTLDGKNNFSYDGKGNMIEKKWAVLHEPRKDSLTYDEKKNVTEMWEYWDNKWQWHYAYKHDDKGNLTEENWFNPDGKFYMKYVFSYNDKGNWNEVTWTNAKGKNCKWTFQYEYDSNGNWTKSTQFLNGKANYILEREITYF